jgi:hypothetical protein
MASMIDACVANMQQSLRHVATDVNTPRSEFRATIRSMETMGDRLKKARKKHFRSADAAAEAHGWSKSGYRSHEAAGKGMRHSRNFGRDIKTAIATAKKYARAFGIDYRELLGNEAAQMITTEVDVMAQRISDLDPGDQMVINRVLEALAAQKNPR